MSSLGTLLCSKRGTLLRRLVPLLLLVPLAYLLRPLLWNPLDARFYDVFLSMSKGAPWQHVIVVGIDRATRATVFTPPIHPLSRHMQAHAAVVHRLDAAGARAIVIDLEFSEEEIGPAAAELADTIAASGKVRLISFMDEVHSSTIRRPAAIAKVRMPAPLLLNASRGAFLVDIELDQDGTFRRFAPDERAAKLGIETLPEHLAGRRCRRPMPVVFPTRERPMPCVSYKDVLRGDSTALRQISGRIALLGQVEDPLSDFVPIPAVQEIDGGRAIGGLPGVAVLASITETLLQGSPLRDASALVILLWNLLWCILTIFILPRSNPWQVLSALIALIAIALAGTGVLQASLGAIFPAGLLLGCLLATGTYTAISAHVETARRLHLEEAERQRVHREMEAARRTQEKLLPKSLPRLPGWDIWGRNISSLEVSGDYYDVIESEDSQVIWLVIADVSGKGMPASLIMSNVHAALQGRIRRGAEDPGEIATDLAAFLYDHTPIESFVTLFLAALHLDSRILNYVIAGHDSPLVLSSSGQWRQCASAGPPLGILPGLSYESATALLHPGDVLCLYTDGVTEALDSREEMFGCERLKHVVIQNRQGSAEELGSSILSAVSRFSGAIPQADDITIVVVKCGISGSA